MTHLICPECGEPLDHLNLNKKAAAEYKDNGNGNYTTSAKCTYGCHAEFNVTVQKCRG